jgi:hypothetical protein
VYVPIRSTSFPANPQTVSTICSAHGGSDINGCIAIYTAPKDSDDQCVIKGTPVVASNSGDVPSLHAKCGKEK